MESQSDVLIAELGSGRCAVVATLRHSSFLADRTTKRGTETALPVSDCKGTATEGLITTE